MNIKIIAVLAVITSCNIYSAGVEHVSPIFKYIEDNNLAAVKKYIDEGGSLSVVDPINHCSPLVYAFDFFNRPNIIKELLTNPKAKSQIKINQVLNNNHNFLTRIIWEDVENWPNGEQLIRLLFDNNIDVNYQMESGLTALMMAAYDGKINYLRLLLSHPKIKLNQQDTTGNTALLSVTNLGPDSVLPVLRRKKNPSPERIEAIKLLLEANADTSIKNNNGDSFESLVYQNPQLEEFLGKTLEAAKQRKDHIKELIDAARDGDIKTVSALLNSVDIDARNEAGITALIRAAQNAQVEMVKFLLAHKANPNIQDSMGYTALVWVLHASPHTKHVERQVKIIIDMLIKHGANQIAQARKLAVKLNYGEAVLTALQ